MACADVDMDIRDAEDTEYGLWAPDINMQIADDEGTRKEDSQKATILRRYQASHHVLVDGRGPMHSLLQKNTAVLGSLQIVSGIFSVGLGVIFAVSHDMTTSLFTLFRVALWTGTLFIFAGVVSTMLRKHPELLPVSLVINRAGIVAALAAVGVIITDLTGWDEENAQYLKMEVLELCMLGLQVLMAVVLCLWISKKKCATFVC
ncbi:uncharacterized protein si:ch211-269k10.4 [Dunckerocampus dactyliophorus]|uniref:uncharacterized protein si:ch211-269k10.4 n=1 Tax=Dunckerocampus dactyliophorus TaxID=161453 RepID=UPI00240547FE|nr:uncharacterized protein si:ch211-269k10.4 [Dunckerocampus dactyliophorus]